MKANCSNWPGRAMCVWMVLLLNILSQNAINAQAGNTEKKYCTAKYFHSAPIIDGFLSDSCWSNCEPAKDFVQIEPVPFAQPSRPTMVYIGYDQENIYVAAKCVDQKDSISKEQSPRDNVGNYNVDYFVIQFDTYDDDLNGFKFVVSAAGSQGDAKIGSFSVNGGTSNNDWNWNGVWDSKVGIGEDGWIVEIKIPLFNLRFPKTEDQRWGFQCNRHVKRLGESMVWQPTDPAINNAMVQWGELNGLKDIRQQLRLSFTPYLATSLDWSPDYDSPTPAHIFSKSLSGGMDIKYGINQNFTLDATLIPDFSQVRSDAKVLNLSPFETRFDENRPFFTEGTDLFNKGNIFYSRRVGGRPVGYYQAFNEIQDDDELKENPITSQLYNAIKFSGRTPDKWAIGVFNAIVGPVDAVIENTSNGNQRIFRTAPLTNYHVNVVQKQFANNSDASLINTFVWRQGNQYRDANVSALLLNLKNKKNTYQLSIQSKWNFIHQLDQSQSPGFVQYLDLSRISGQFGWGMGAEAVNAQWDPSDLGYYNGNNYANTWAGIWYNQYTAKKYILQSNYWFNINYGTQYKPFQYRSFSSNFGFWVKLKNNWNVNWWSYLVPVPSYEYNEPRVEGRKYKYVPYYNGGININTDYRKALGCYFYLGTSREFRTNYYNYSFSIEPTWRITNTLNFNCGVSYYPVKNEHGFITVLDNQEIIFGARSQTTYVTFIGGRWTPTKHASLGINLRHYAASVVINKFHLLNLDGTLGSTDYTGDHDFQVNFLNLDGVFNYEFRPGSFLQLIWKNSGDRFDYIQDKTSIDYFRSVKDILNTIKQNTLTVKCIYFLNYNDLTKKRKLNSQK